MKEQVARLITGKPSKIEVNGEWIDDPLHEMDIMNNMELAKQILNLFKAEVDKLTVIDVKTTLYDTRTNIGRASRLAWERGTKAQLQDIKRQLLDLMGE